MRPALYLVATALAAGAAQANPEPKTSLLESYKSTNEFNVALCRLKYQTALARREAAALIAESGNTPKPVEDDKADYQGCISAAKQEGKANFDKAMKTVKKPAAKEALKTYHVAFMSAIDGVPAGSDEMRMHYNARRQALDARLNEAWSRFEIEQ